MSATNLQRVSLGFMPLLDCATLVVAAEKGFGAAEGLDLRLSRESSWANIRDRVVVGHFDAAQMLGPMVVAATLGLGLDRRGAYLDDVHVEQRLDGLADLRLVRFVMDAEGVAVKRREDVALL